MVGVGGVVNPLAARDAPHSPQKCWPGGFWCPFLQSTVGGSRAAPHSPQKCCPDGFWWPLEQVTTRSAPYSAVFRNYTLRDSAPSRPSGKGLSTHLLKEQLGGDLAGLVAYLDSSGLATCAEKVR